MAKVIIFGVKDLAQLAHFYLTNDSDHEVVAFSVNAGFLPENKTFMGLPVVPFENIQLEMEPSIYSFFAPMTHIGMNKNRERIYSEIKGKGYNLINYISTKATIYKDLEIGDNCFVLEDNTIQPFVKIGSNTILWSGNHIGHHSKIGNHVFITSHVVISGNCNIESFCFLGINTSIKEETTIGEGTFIAMATSIINSTESYSVYSGNPAKRIDMLSLNIRF